MDMFGMMEEMMGNVVSRMQFLISLDELFKIKTGAYEQIPV